MERLISGWFSFDPKDREASAKAAQDAELRQEEQRVIKDDQDKKIYVSAHIPGFVTWGSRGRYLSIASIKSIEIYEFKHFRAGESCAFIHFQLMHGSNHTLQTTILPYAQTNELVRRLLSGTYTGLLMDGLAEATGAAVTKGGPGGDVEQGIAPSTTTK